MAEPVNRRTNAVGGKFYLHPLTDEKFDSVTTILDLIDKDKLKIWAAGLAADMTFEYLPQIVNSMLEPPCGNTYNRCYEKHGRENRCERCPCGICEKCWHRKLKFKHSAESSRRAQEGTECHEAINHWVLNGGSMVSLRPEVEPYFQSFLRFAEDYALTPRGADGGGSWEQTEVTLLNREHGYAGTSDAAIWIRRGTTASNEILRQIGGAGMDEALVRVDYKTREKPDERLYNDMPMQGVAYERCEVAMLPNGEEVGTPRTQARMVLQLRPGPNPELPGDRGYTFKPMLTDDSTFDAFLGVLAAYRWIQKYGKSAFSTDTVWPATPEPIKVQAETPGKPLEAVEVDVLDSFGDDPWAVGDKVQMGGLTFTKIGDDPFAGPEPPAPPVPVPSTPPRKTAKRAPTKAQQAAAFAKHGPGPTMQSLRDFEPGAPLTQRLADDIPF